MQNKGHHHVHESGTFSKRSTWCKQTLTPNRNALTESRHELIPLHSHQTLTTRIVRKLYPKDPKHICNKLQCDRNVRTSNASEEKRYWTINLVHVGVKLLDKHKWIGDRDVTSDSHPLLWMTEGRSMSAKSDKMTWRSKWMPRLEKFSKNALKASSSRNQIWEYEEALKRRRFRAGVDLHLGSIDTTIINRKRGRERKDNRKSPKQYQIYQIYWKESMYAWEMHKHVACKGNCIMGSAQTKPISTQTNSRHLNA